MACHPFIIGELASEPLRNRAEIPELLGRRPVALVATHEEALVFGADRRYALRMYASTFLARMSSGTLPPSTTASLNALMS